MCARLILIKPPDARDTARVDARLLSRLVLFRGVPCLLTVARTFNFKPVALEISRGSVTYTKRVVTPANPHMVCVGYFIQISDLQIYSRIEYIGIAARNSSALLF